MFIEQLSIFIENKPGRLFKLTTLLAENKIDLLTLSIADTKDFGILRTITNDNEKAVNLLKENGFTVSKTKLIGCYVNDEPGGLAYILGIFEKENISIEYLYSYSKTSDKHAIILFRVENIERAKDILSKFDLKFIDRL